LYAVGAVALAIAVRTYIRYPIALAVALVLVLAYIAVSVTMERRLARKADDRQAEDIGTFARAFDRRSPNFDPWVVRATWDALAPWSVLRSKRNSGARLPLRPTDDLSDVFGIVNEDVDDVVEEVAKRSGRSLDDIRGNPYKGRVRTVGDVVQFVSHQPRRPAA